MQGGISFQKELYRLISEIDSRTIETTTGNTSKQTGNNPATGTRIIQNRDKGSGGHPDASKGQDETGFAVFEADEATGEGGVCC